MARPVLVVAAGAVLGIVATLSPGGLVMVTILAGLIAWAVRDTTARERRWVLTWLTVTMGARVAAVGALTFLVKPAQQSFATIAGGDAFYLLQRSIWIRNILVGQSVAPRDYFEAFDALYGFTGYNYVLAWFHVLFGPSPYAAHLASTVFFLCAAVLMYRLVRARYGPRPALIGLLVVTVLPTLFAWSIAPLKEAPYLLLAAIVVRAALEWQSDRWGRGVIALAVIAVALLAIRSLREDAAALTALALATGVIAWWALQSRRGLAVVACGLLAAVVAAISVPVVTAAVRSGVSLAIHHHIGHVLTEGHSFRLLYDDAYFVRPAALAPEAVIGFVALGVVRFFSVPEPWILKGTSEVALLPQQALWYVLVILGALGMLAGYRRDRRLTCLFAGFVATGAVLIGINSGNIGTMIRHRDMIVPFAVWLAAVGAAQQIERGPWRGFNRVDTWAIACLAALAAGGALYLGLRTPAPAVESVVPARVYGPGRIALRGRHLKPFLHAYLIPPGQRFSLLARADSPVEVPYLLKNPTEAELDLPSHPAGVFDVALVESGDLIARLGGALTILHMADQPVGVVIVEGRFEHLDANVAQPLTPGTTIRQADGATVVEILRAGPESPQLAAVGPGFKTWVRLDAQRERASVLRLRCQVISARCVYAGQAVVADGTLTLPFPRGATTTFVVDAVRPDGAAASAPTAGRDALVDFITFPDTERAVRVGDLDAGAPLRRPVHPARITRILGSERFVGDAALAGEASGDLVAVQQPLVRIRAEVEFAQDPSGALEWRNRSLNVGDRFTFDTSAYRLDGTVVGHAR